MVIADENTVIVEVSGEGAETVIGEVGGNEINHNLKHHRALK